MRPLSIPQTMNEWINDHAPFLEWCYTFPLLQTWWNRLRECVRTERERETESLTEIQCKATQYYAVISVRNGRIQMFLAISLALRTTEWHRIFELSHKNFRNDNWKLPTSTPGITAITTVMRHHRLTGVSKDETFTTTKHAAWPFHLLPHGTYRLKWILRKIIWWMCRLNSVGLMVGFCNWKAGDCWTHSASDWCCCKSCLQFVSTCWWWDVWHLFQ